MITHARGLELDSMRVEIAHQAGDSTDAVLWLTLADLDGSNRALLAVLPDEMPALVDLLRAAIDDHLAWRAAVQGHRRRPVIREPDWLSGWQWPRPPRWP